MPQIVFNADWLGVVIVCLSFEKPKLKVYTFNRATLSHFAMMKFTTNKDLIKRKRYFHLLANDPGLPKNRRFEVFSWKKSSYKKYFMC